MLVIEQSKSSQYFGDERPSHLKPHQHLDFLCTKSKRNFKDKDKERLGNKAYITLSSRR